MLKEFFEKEKIEYYSAVKGIGEFIVNPNKLARFTEDIQKPLAAIVFLCPYYQGENVNGGISRYAFPRDYHLYFRELFGQLTKFSEKHGKELRFAGFSDNSPFSEVRLAASAGLGTVGRNGLLINEKYGSYIFIGEIVLSENDAEGLAAQPGEARRCSGCGLCSALCPTGALSGNPEKCLSYLSQKKKITSEEAELLRVNCCLWGCDKCQEVCPHNKNAAVSPIPFFSNDLITELTPELLGEKTDFAQRLGERAFSWRGYDVLKRNLDINKDK